MRIFLKQNLCNAFHMILKLWGSTCKAKEAMKAHVIEVRTTWVSNYRDPMTKSLNWIPVIDQFRYFKIQPKTIDLSTRLWGITTVFVGFIV